MNTQDTNSQLSLNLLKLENQLCFRLYAASRNMTRLYTPLLEQYNLTYPQYIILLVLFEHKEIDFKELSKIVDLKTGTLTPIIQKLEEIQYIYKTVNPNDGRRINIELTQKGESLKDVIINVPLKLSQLIQFSYDEYNEIIKQLDHLSLHLFEAQQKLKEEQK